MEKRQKTWIQEQFPEFQTPCYKAAGGPCNETTYYVGGIIRLMVQTTGEKVRHTELHDLFHCFCFQSNFGPDASGFVRRVNTRIENGQL